MLEDFGDDPL
jgi:tartrate dehydratase beta subunit/fumarate hydratase class I family protein